ncbi:MAG TPA: zinc-ribbon domain-containing protein [Clostridia bacterium]
MADKTLTCKDCNNEFTFTEGEQAFYKEKGFENEPQRCPDCRAAKKQQQRGNNRGGNSNRGYGNRW